MASDISFELKGIGQILAQNRLAVPLNQREYAWEKDHVKELFQDFSNALAKGNSGYFLGTIVLTKGGGEYPEVSDGQQRLATTTVLIAAIRDYFAERGDQKRAGAIADEFLRTVDRKTTDTVSKLRLNVDDQEFFRQVIISDPAAPERNLPPIKQSHKRMAVAADAAREYVVNYLAQHKPEYHADRLNELLDFIEAGAQVIVLKVPDHINAFVMFETLNDRGLRASQADLLKNHLLSLCGERIAEGQQKWAKMVGVLESLDQDDITVTYLHHMLINKYGPTREREVFDRIKRSVTGQLDAIAFLDELADGATHYAALFNSDHKKWNEYGTLTKKNISTINQDLRVQQIRPLMLAVARKFSVEEGKLAFRAFVFWSVRFLIVGGRGGLLDRNYSVAANEVADGKITTAAILAARLGDIIPSNAVFEAAFTEAKIAQNYFARYLLRAMEQRSMNLAEPEFVPNDAENSINLEHVLPENPSDQWPNVDTETAAAWFRRLGNLVLLQSSKNNLIGNSAFEKKQAVLKDSGFELTKLVGNEPQWGPKEIAARQARLATLATQTWPV